jgi:hemerythrin
MEWIVWSEVLATGHAILDTDHEHLVKLFNQLALSVKERRGKAAGVELLNKIIGHSQVHFAFEEHLMAEQHYPKADQHTAEHARLIRQALRYKAKFEADAPDLHIPLIHFPEDWLTFHILVADRELADFLSVAD